MKISKDKQQHELVWVSPDTTVVAAARKMVERHVGALVVLHRQKLAGILSERDLARRVVAEELDPAATPVSRVMTSPVITASQDASVKDVVDLMRSRHIRHVPLVGKDGEPVAMVSIRVVLEARLRELVHENRSLASYLMTDGSGG